MNWKYWKVELHFILLLFEIIYYVQSSTTPLLVDTKPKRSPLEIGYVQFTIPSTENHHNAVTLHLPAFVIHGSNTTSISHTVPKTHHQMLHTHYRDEWIPGHVVNHVFIPGKVHHVLVPLVAHPVHTVLVHSVHVPMESEYRKHYGGFGIGVDTGGRGAGHGYYAI